MSAVGWTAMKSALVGWVRTATGLAEARVIFAGQNLGRPPGDGAFVAIRRADTQGIGSDWNDHEHRPLVFADKAVASVDAGTDSLAIVAHALVTGDGPVHLETTGTAPAGLAIATDYWIVVSSAGVVRLAATFLEAIAAIPTVVPIGDAGAGSHSIVATDDTVRRGEEITTHARGQRRVVYNFEAYPPRDATDATEADALLNDVMTALALPSVAEAIDAAGFAVSGLGPIAQLDGVLNSTRFEPRAIMMVVCFIPSELSEPGTIIENVNVEDEERPDRDFPVDLTD